MTIVFGAGKEAETYIREFSGTDEIVCYDNDRRKWGKTISGIPIITLEKYYFYELTKQKMYGEKLWM